MGVSLPRSFRHTIDRQGRGSTARSRTTKSHPFLRALLVAVVAALLGLTPTIVRWVNAPPSDSTVITLMNQDVKAALHHDGDLAVRSYSPNAVIIDAGCRSPRSGTVATGSAAIRQRYYTLPRFSYLAHVNVHISWLPNSSSASQATATGDTLGAMQSGTSQTPLRGHEEWTFALTNGHWRITGFTYNLCMPASS